MKSLLIMVALAVAGYFAWQKLGADSGPPLIDDPVFGEMRVTVDMQGREIEMAMFARMASEADCKARAHIVWEDALEACPSCNLQPASCKNELPPRYARLFDDEPIPTIYLSLTAGLADERDGRLVVYGLTDKEGAVVCEQMRKVILQKYTGTAHCVAASGG